MEAANSGLYCGPLRLLAHEIFDRFNNKGIPCNLVTGEERRELEGVSVPLTSSTIEMANLQKPVDVAVIDEIQMISDSQRGWAWTQALFGWSIIFIFIYLNLILGLNHYLYFLLLLYRFTSERDSYVW